MKGLMIFLLMCGNLFLGRSLYAEKHITVVTANSLNEHKIGRDLQQKTDHFIRSRPKYEPLNSLFAD